MVCLQIKKEKVRAEISRELLEGKRRLSHDEIELLEKNLNSAESWEQVFVDASAFDATLVKNCFFAGFVIFGKMQNASLKYHDLELDCGVYDSKLRDVVLGDDNAIYNVSYLENYRLGKNVMLFNVQEMSCTKHSKFGNGILKNGESEDARIWIDVANENSGRAILPFEKMITADAYLWSRRRDDDELMKKFLSFTENGNTGECNTFGKVGDNVVIKNTTLLKDANIGNGAYIKGAFKLKNITVLSSETESSQIGEGVELVNGIVGFGTRIFYQAVAVRFVIGRNCQLKYGARLLHSVLGDNSTVSCCEILNNLVFPFHEQHHNSSFLIASTIMGQSNVASGATIGSNHNSRSPDGELIAHRGFWPGLSSDFKHNSRFASFVLVTKGSYQNELDIQYPFSLVSLGQNGDMSIYIVPAWWFMYDMFALVRNKYKYASRDKRKIKVQNIEADPFAPDTIQEILFALERIEFLTAEILPELLGKRAKARAKKKVSLKTKMKDAKEFLEENEKAVFTLRDMQCQRKFGATIFKAPRAYALYNRIVRYFAVREIAEFCNDNGIKKITMDVFEKIDETPLYTSWENVGGQIIAKEKIDELTEKIKSSEIKTWDEVHAFYDAEQKNYKNYKARYAVYLLEYLSGKKIETFSKKIFLKLSRDACEMAKTMYRESVSSREKDYTDYYRKMTYRNQKEMDVVLGTLSSNDFLQTLKKDTDDFCARVSELFK